MIKIFHHNDMDGRAAASIAACKKVWHVIQIADNDGMYSLSNEMKEILHDYETKSIFVECDYASNAINPSLVAEGDTVYILDLSFSLKTYPTLVEICQKAKDVIWLDHHATSKQLVDSGNIDNISNLTKIIDTTKCGTMLSWEHFIAPDCPMFVEYVNDYDCWYHKLGDNTTFFKLGIDMRINYADADVWRKLIDDALIERSVEGITYKPMNGTNYESIRIINDGQVAKRYIDCQNASYFKQYSFESIIDGINCICVNWKTNSWVFGEAYNHYPMCCVFAFNGSVWSYSLYSSHPDVDCSKIAEKFSGGGHRGAAGFSLPYCLFSTCQ